MLELGQRGSLWGHLYSTVGREAPPSRRDLLAAAQARRADRTRRVRDQIAALRAANRARAIKGAA